MELPEEHLYGLEHQPCCSRSRKAEQQPRDEILVGIFPMAWRMFLVIYPISRPPQK